MTCHHLSQEYFFDPEVLTEGEVAPNDRCCRICGKIGHFMKDCPLRKRLVKKQCQLLVIILSMANYIYVMVVYFIGAGPNIERTLRDDQNTCETKWIQERTPGIRSDRGVSTGGREMHWRCAAATCVDQAPTSRRTVSCTEALQVQFLALNITSYT